MSWQECARFTGCCCSLGGNKDCSGFCWILMELPQEGELQAFNHGLFWDIGVIVIVASVSVCFINPIQTVGCIWGLSASLLLRHLCWFLFLKLQSVKGKSSSLNNDRKYFLYETCYNKGSFMVDLQQSPHILNILLTAVKPYLLTQAGPFQNQLV